MKFRIASYFRALLAGLAIFAGSVSAQTIAYRQTNLASDVNIPNFAHNTNASLRNSWGITFMPGISFFIANTNSGRGTAHASTGAPNGFGQFIVQNTAGNGPGSPAGIVADSNLLFGNWGNTQPFVVSVMTATRDGGIYFWGVDANGDIPVAATLEVNNSAAGAVYTSLAILKPDCCAPVLAVTNFHSGLVELFDVNFAPLGSFRDPSLPPGFAPFGMQIIGNQLFVASALQNDSKHDPVFGAGAGVISVFDLQGQFVRRFAAGGSLNAPWGIIQASANFGPFSNDILIGSVGDGTISAFDPATGNFIGQLKDGDGNVLVNSRIHGITFRNDGLGDPNALFFTAGINNGQDGLLGAITTGLVSTTMVSVPNTPVDSSATITVTVGVGQGNAGIPTGSVAIQDGSNSLSNLELVNGVASFDTIFTTAESHVIKVRYSGDSNFLPSAGQVQVEVASLATSLILTAPATAAPGSTMILTATITSTGGIPAGQIAFLDGNTVLGMAPLDASGIAVLRVNTLALGAHSLTATFAGDEKFGSSSSAVVTTTIASPDFSVGANPASATVTAGQSTQFMLTIVPAGGFAGDVTLSCAPVVGITCTFAPPTVTLANGAAPTMLTVTTSAGVLHFGGSMVNGMMASLLLAAVALFAIARRRGANTQRPRPVRLVFAAALSVFVISLTLGGCNGSANSVQTNRGTATITVMAQSGAVSHSTAVMVTVQ